MKKSPAFRFGLPIAGFVILAALPLIFSDAFVVAAVTLAFLGAAASLAWNLSGGYAGQLSLGHAAFYGIGAYVSTILFLKAGISPLIGMWLGAILSGILAVLLGAVTMRLKGSFFVMSTLAFGAVVHISAINLRDFTGGSSGLAIPLRPSPENLIFAKKLIYTYLALGLVVIFYVITRIIAASKVGYALVAFRENHDAARALGIRTLPLRIGVFALSAGLISICGTLHAQYYLYIDPDSVMGLNLSLNFALMAILGGLGTAYGPIVGALLVSVVSVVMQVYLGDQISGLTQLAYAAIVILVLLAAPMGIGPSAHAFLKRRLAWRS
ncbi:branched-chain amino acid ABC transporter permease [Bradyrhizobium betae]|uniref:Branched-chain amino acid ABC transporter permease n=1 Tax=Bradyrhizobium betae TaxID=244734 RepID=A0A5P6PCL3_9BRAD|nr:branched-chain amino acid ABC transporter permease [Bradyrhizobium betae]MCS3726835.1 branched-chain amino acid transport system permease protein [Bradyrhizobium betae]QFI75223.1 branched-chain amino acid ABC transporter permease [Bradyrhizobium betae]